MRVFSTAGYRINMIASISGKEAKLNYTIKPFARNIFVAILPVEMYGRNLEQVYFCIKHG
jgi:hypothetical protein